VESNPVAAAQERSAASEYAPIIRRNAGRRFQPKTHAIAGQT